MPRKCKASIAVVSRHCLAHASFDGSYFKESIFLVTGAHLISSISWLLVCGQSCWSQLFYRPAKVKFCNLPTYYFCQKFVQNRCIKIAVPTFCEFWPSSLWSCRYPDGSFVSLILEIFQFVFPNSSSKRFMCSSIHSNTAIFFERDVFSSLVVKYL